MDSLSIPHFRNTISRFPLRNCDNLVRFPSTTTFQEPILQQPTVRLGLFAFLKQPAETFVYIRHKARHTDSRIKRIKITIAQKVVERRSHLIYYYWKHVNSKAMLSTISPLAAGVCYRS